MVDSDRGFATAQTKPDYQKVLKYTERIRKLCGEEYSLGNFRSNHKRKQAQILIKYTAAKKRERG